MRRCFNGVDVEVIGERMIDVKLQHRIKYRHNLLGAGLRVHQHVNKRLRGGKGISLRDAFPQAAKQVAKVI